MTIDQHRLDHAAHMAGKSGLPTTIIIHRAEDLGLTYHTLRAAVMIERGQKFSDLGRPVVTVFPPRWFE